MAEKDQWGNICARVSTCALTGAAAFFAGIPDAGIIANGPLWCYFYALRHIEKNNPEIAWRFHGTQPDNHSVVYGTEDCLLETLQRYKDAAQPGVLLIENSCSVSLIGDDIAGIAKRADLDCPVICFDSGGLIGGFCEGYRIAARGYLAGMALAAPETVSLEERTVNLLGCTTSYYNGMFDLHELKRILHSAGYTVLSCPGAGSSVEEIGRMTKASLNIVIHAELGLALAQELEARYSMPFIAPLPPYGLGGTKGWLEEIHAVLPADLSLVLAEIEAEEKTIYAQINEIKGCWGELYFDRVVISAPSSTALGLAGVLRREWVDTEELTVILQDVPTALPLIEDIDQLLYAARDGRKIEEQMKTIEDALVMGSSSESSVLRREGKYGVVLCNIAFPVYDELLLTQEPFMGIRGAKHMLERLWNGKMQQLLYGPVNRR